MQMLYCTFCMYVRKEENKPAITIVNGQAVCEDHAYYVQGGEHGRILAVIRLDEKKEHPACTQKVNGVKARSISAKVRRGHG